MTQTKKPTGQTAEAPPSPPSSPSHEHRKCAPEDEPMVMNMFHSSAKPDDASNSDDLALSNGSAPPTPLSTLISEIPQKGQMLGEGPQQLVTLTGLKDLLMEVIQELKAGPAALQSEATPEPEPKPAVAPLGSKLEFKRVEQVYGPFMGILINKETVKEELDELDHYAFVVRSRGGKWIPLTFNHENSIKRVVCIDIKSKHLRSVLRDIMKNVKTVSLQEKKPSVRHVSFQTQSVTDPGRLNWASSTTSSRTLKRMGPRPIDLLSAFPLQYHPDEEAVRQNLTECGRKFCRLVRTHIRHCRKTAFFIERRVPVRVKIDSRVGIDATFFREMNPNYLRPRVEKRIHDEQRQRERERVKSDGASAFDMNDDDYLTCCPTLPGFSLKNNAFYEFAVEDISDIK
ncbi:hypothetical protein EMCG_07937 [[Emmonsia] crescens]|uniref:Uncharacterized protein n=1 Tax=[Emmonsia] crescens TaxID=73230 RepID=A0A0G2JAU4_9EURO|nr:hypothetical protein EMCG_07937 [Emmonsia crescens UAMH 3008]